MREISHSNYDIINNSGYRIIRFKQEILLDIIRIYTHSIIDEKNIPSIEISNNDKTWDFCNDIRIYNDFIDINIYGRSVFLIKIKSEIIIKDLKFYIRKYPGLFMMYSHTGWGDRMLALLNAMYLAKKTGFNFGFTWDCLKINYLHKKDTLSQSEVCSEDELFDESFLYEHSYTANYTSPYKLKLENKEWVDFSFATKNSVDDYCNKPFQYYWGYAVNHNNLSCYVKNIDKNYVSNFPILWSEIKFNQKILNMFDDIEKIWSSFSKDKKILAIHVRSGDIVYLGTLNIYSHSGHDYYWNKAMPVEIVFELIYRYKKEYNILLFGEDIDTLKSIYEYFYSKVNNIYLADKIIPNGYAKGWKRDFFELVLMSKADKIIGGDSGFCRLASYIRSGKEHVNWSKLFNSDEKYSIFNKFYNTINVHNMQRSFSLIYIYMGEVERKNYLKAKNIIEQAISFDSSRMFHYIVYLYCCLNLNQMEQCERCLNNVLSRKRDEFIDIILHTPLYCDIRDILFANSQYLDYPNLSFLVIKFMKNENILFGCTTYDFYYFNDSAVFRITNSLSYKLGNTLIKAKTLKSKLMLPINLLLVMLDFKARRKYYNLLRAQYNLKENKLSDCKDYKQAICYKNHLSYKIGNCLVKNPFTFVFKIYNIYKYHKITHK